MAVTYYQFESNTSDIPTAAGGASPTTITRGFNGVNGTLQSMLFRLQLTTSGATYRSDAGALWSSLRIISNGQVYFDYQGTFDSTDLAAPQPSTLGYLINSIGGKAYQVPTANDSTSVDYYLEIPMGAVLSGPEVPRFEITMGYRDADEWVKNAAGGSISSGIMSYWGIYNDATQTQTRTLASTSYVHPANSVNQVVVKVGNIEEQFPGATVAGVLIQNNSAADEYGTQGIRPLVLSQFGMDVDLHRWANGDMNNEIMAYVPEAVNDSTTVLGEVGQRPFASTLGVIFVPLYASKGGDIVFVIDSSAATTRTYTPVITYPISGKAISAVSQSQADPVNTDTAVLARTQAV